MCPSLPIVDALSGIGLDALQRKGRSLAIQLPVFLIELGLQFAIALYVASRRASAADLGITLLSVLGMSIPTLSIYMGRMALWRASAMVPGAAGWGSGSFQLHSWPCRSW